MKTEKLKTIITKLRNEEKIGHLIPRKREKREKLAKEIANYLRENKYGYLVFMGVMDSYYDNYIFKK